MKKLSSLLMIATVIGCLAMAIVFLLPPAHDAKAAGKKKEYITAQELYGQTRGGWYQEYTAPKHKTYGGIPDEYSFLVNVDLEMPEVSKVPILDLVINKDVLKDDTTSVEIFVKGQVREDGRVVSNTMFGWDEKDEPYGIFFDPNFYGVGENQKAENNPLTPEDAKAFFHKAVLKYFGKDNVEVDVIAGSKVTPVLPDGMDPQQQEFYPVLEKGVYELEGSQFFEGIPLVASGGSWRRYFPGLLFRLQFIDEQTYRLEGTTFNQTAVVHEDVPLLPWSEIQRTFEEECLGKNRMYNVYSVRFGYQLTITRKGKNTGYAGYIGDRKTYPEGTFDETYTTRPVWVIRGFVPVETKGMLLEEQIESQKKSIEQQPDWQRLFQSWGGQSLIINAQTGELINYTTDLDKLDDVFPKILTWDDVGGK